MPPGTQSIPGDPAASELQERVERARQDYERIVEAARRLTEQTGYANLADGDRLAAIRKARQIQEIATQQYAEALKALSDFVLGRQTGNRS
jgi:hypothetical protein